MFTTLLRRPQLNREGRPTGAAPNSWLLKIPFAGNRVRRIETAGRRNCVNELLLVNRGDAHLKACREIHTRLRLPSTVTFLIRRNP